MLDLPQIYTIFRTEKVLDGCASGTIDNYDVIIGKFTQEHSDVPIESIAKAVNHQLAKWSQSNIKRSTMSSYYRLMRVFTGWLYVNKYTQEPVRVPFIKEPIPVISSLDTSQVYALLRSFDTSTFNGLRAYTAVQLMLGTGLRRAEVTSLLDSDIDLHNRLVLVRDGKGHKDAQVPFTRALRQDLFAYHKQAVKVRRCPHWFISTMGKPVQPRAINDILKRASKRVGFKVHPHQLRHTYAINFLRNGGTTLILQQLMRHSDIEMTQRYTKMSTISLGDMVDKFMR